MADGIDPRVGDVSKSTVTFDAFVRDDFLRYAEKEYKTFKNQLNMLEKRILKEFGKSSLSEITKRQIMLFHKRVCEETSKSTGNKYLSLQSSIFKYAIRGSLVQIQST
jgi:hypothetical protein